MPSAPVSDLSLLLDATVEGEKWRYTAALVEGSSEEAGRLLAEGECPTPFHVVAAKALSESSAERCGVLLFDWALPPEGEARRALLRRCEEIGSSGGALRLWVSVGPRLADLLEFRQFERNAKATWEGFWIREWAEDAMRPSWVESPFLALNSWVHVLRRPRGLRMERRFTVAGKLNVLIVVSNPPRSHPEWHHIYHLEREDGSGMLRRVYRAFEQHRGVGWVHVLRNPSKVAIAWTIREHKPHVVVYLGHGYAHYQYGSGLALAAPDGESDFQLVSGVRKFPDQESELEQMLAGKADALRAPGTSEDGLPSEERPRMLVGFACWAAPAGSALLQAGLPAALMMRRELPDDEETEEFVRQCVKALADESRSIEEAVAGLRRFLGPAGPRVGGERVHFSVPVLHLAPLGQLEPVWRPAARLTRLFPDEEEYARGEYIRRMRARCGLFGRIFKDSPMNDLTETSYVEQRLGELVKERIPTPRGLEEREVEHQREFREALRLHRQVVVIGRAGRGKTSLLYWAMLRCLKELEEDETQVVPVYVPLKELQEVGSLKALKEYLEAQLAEARVSSWLWTNLEKSDVWLFLDGLDEVPRERWDERTERREPVRLAFLNDRGLLAELVRRLEAPQARIVLTCRDGVYSEVAERLSELRRPGEREGFVRMELKPFKREQIVAYARQFFRGDEERAQAFLRDIEDPRRGALRYTHLAEEPLYLHMLCWLWAGYSEETATS